MKKLSKFLAKVTLLSLFFLTVTPAVVPALVSDAQAQVTTSGDVNNNILVTTLCNMMKIITGNAGKAIAAFAIVAVGVGFFTGKVSWGLLVGVTAGVAAMFGAPTIVSAISGKSAYDCQG
ncbi:MAG: TrbC/VirB2 family protein [Rickettsiales bacterium]|nr:TrbC/VirB2 family protein [Rickettsiales bacterium]